MASNFYWISPLNLELLLNYGNNFTFQCHLGWPVYPKMISVIRRFETQPWYYESLAWWSLHCRTFRGSRWHSGIFPRPLLIYFWIFHNQRFFISTSNFFSMCQKFDLFFASIAYLKHPIRLVYLLNLREVAPHTGIAFRWEIMDLHPSYFSKVDCSVFSILDLYHVP